MYSVVKGSGIGIGYIGDSVFLWMFHADFEIGNKASLWEVGKLQRLPSNDNWLCWKSYLTLL